MEKDFDRWNILKKKIESYKTDAMLFPKVGEVWMISIGKNIGYEQNGSGNNFSRPALIIKKFNRNMFWMIPLSTKQKNLDFYFNFQDPFDRSVSAIIAQLKLVSVKRLRRKLYDLSERDLFKIRTIIKNSI